MVGITIFFIMAGKTYEQEKNPLSKKKKML